MSEIDFRIILRKPIYPVIIVSADELYSAYNIEQLANGCVNAIPIDDKEIIKVIDSKGDEFWYSICNYALSPGFGSKKWTKKQVIGMYNESSNIIDTELKFPLTSLSSKRLDSIVGELCERLKA